MEHIFWTGYSGDERHAAIDKIEHIVLKYGDVVDFKLFSDISITLTIEMEESQIDELYDELSHNMGMNRFEYLHSISKKERIVYLNISFTKGTGNLHNETLNVPG